MSSNIPVVAYSELMMDTFGLNSVDNPLSDLLTENVGKFLSLSVNVTDKKGKTITHRIVPTITMNKKGTYSTAMPIFAIGEDGAFVGGSVDGTQFSSVVLGARNKRVNAKKSVSLPHMIVFPSKDVKDVEYITSKAMCDMVGLYEFVFNHVQDIADSARLDDKHRMLLYKHVKGMFLGLKDDMYGSTKLVALAVKADENFESPVNKMDVIFSCGAMSEKRDENNGTALLNIVSMGATIDLHGPMPLECDTFAIYGHDSNINTIGRDTKLKTLDVNELCPKDAVSGSSYILLGKDSSVDEINMSTKNKEGYISSANRYNISATKVGKARYTHGTQDNGQYHHNSTLHLDSEEIDYINIGINKIGDRHASTIDVENASCKIGSVERMSVANIPSGSPFVVDTQNKNFLQQVGFAMNESSRAIGKDPILVVGSTNATHAWKVVEDMDGKKSLVGHVNDLSRLSKNHVTEPVDYIVLMDMEVGNSKRNRMTRYDAGFVNAVLNLKTIMEWGTASLGTDRDSGFIQIQTRTPVQFRKEFFMSFSPHDMLEEERRELIEMSNTTI